MMSFFKPSSPYREPVSGETNTETTKEIDVEISRSVVKCNLTLTSGEGEEIAIYFKTDQIPYNVTIDLTNSSISNRNKFYDGKLNEAAQEYITSKFTSAHAKYAKWREKLHGPSLFIDINESRIINKSLIAQIDALTYPEKELHHFIFTGIKNER